MLAARVSPLRRQLKVGLGDGGDEPMTRAIRAHGNALEWGLPPLLLMLVAELNHASRPLLHVCGIVFLLARIAHSVGLSTHRPGSRGRIVGSAVSWLVLAVLALWNIGAFLRTLLASALT